MSLRAQLPVYSPLTGSALWAGGKSWVAGGSGAAVAVAASLRSTFACQSLCLTDSGTSALTMALRLATTLKPGPVALPAYCCYDLATAADGASVKVLLYDLDPRTLAPDTDSLKRALDAGARTIVVVHLYGIGIDVRAVRAIADGRDALFVEDAAQAAGARSGGQPAGSLGDLAVLSFGRGKGTTGGSGGALLAYTPELALGVREYAEQLPSPRGGGAELIRLVAQWILARPAVYGIPSSLPFLGLGQTHYRFARAPGGLSGLAAGVLTRTLGSAAAELSRRRANAATIGGGIPALPEQWTITWPADVEPGFLRFPVVVAPRTARAAEGEEARALGIMRGYPLPLADLERFQPRILNPREPLPGARLLAERLITLPTHSLATDGDLPQLMNWLSRNA